METINEKQDNNMLKILVEIGKLQFLLESYFSIPTDRYPYLSIPSL